MKLQTIIPLQKTDNPIGYKSKVLLLGSCFVENIGQKLEYFKFQTVQNPFGILFHPLAIENLIERAVVNQTYQKKAIFEQESIWHCFDAHSDLSAKSEEELLRNLNFGLKEAAEALRASTHIIITLGTAWVYRHKNSKIAANCHKVPQKKFEKELLSVESIQSGLVRIVELIQSENKKAQIIFTISPVRHLKDGFVENQRSKAHLISAIHRVNSDFVLPISYFPSYEIMMDELRDYRFYGRDMVHPNPLAVDYIWERFKNAWISPESHPIMDEVETIQKGLQHKPFNPESDAHRRFEKSLEAKIIGLQEKHPFIRFE